MNTLTAPCAPAQTATASNTPVSRQPSERLRAMLRFSKRSEAAPSYEDVAKVLGELYHPKMSLADAMHHLVATYEEVLTEPRYEVGGSSTAVLALVLAPIKGFSAIDFMGPRTLDVSYTVKQYYDAMAGHIFSQLRIARVDWLDEDLF